MLENEKLNLNLFLRTENIDTSKWNFAKSSPALFEGRGKKNENFHDRIRLMNNEMKKKKYYDEVKNHF